MDKSLYQAPAGIAQLDDGEPELEIEIVDPEEVSIKGPGFELEIKKDGEGVDFNDNLAEEMDASELQSLAEDLASDIDNDKMSRKDWEDTYKNGLTLLGLKYEERTEPWSGACGVFHPMITEAVVRFQAETITETFPARGPVRTKIIGKETPEKKDAAVRVEEDMNYQLTEKMTEFRPEHERMLWSLPATGSAFKKVYYDPNLGRQVSMFVPAEDVLLPYGTTELATCGRVTHIMRKTENDLVKLQNAGFYMDVDLGEPTKFKSEIQEKKDKETGFAATYDDRYELFECHVDLDLKGFEDEDDDGPTGIALPYVVTMIRGSNEILAIRRNWKEDDSLKLKRAHFVHYQYIPGFGAYGFGLFHLIGGYATSATALMRQLVDAGTLSNLPGGLKSRGLRIKGDDTPIAPGEWRDVDIGSGAIRDNILPLPYKEPSATLYQLLGTIVEEGRRFAATADIQVSDMSANAPVGTTLAILERTLKVMSAVQARVHFAFKQELKLLAGIIRDYTDPDYTYEPDEGTPRAKQSDYSQVDIIPVSDPNAATMSQRVVQYQAALQLAQGAPQLYDMPMLHRQMLEILGIKNANKLVPMDDDKKPQDPVSENMNVLNLKPVKAFMYQDHEAHIKVHMAATQDPLIQQMAGQNPQAPMIMQAMQAHIMEHISFAYRAKIEQALGADLPKPDEEMNPAVEVQLSRLVAQAAPMVLQQSQSQVAQQKAQAAAQQAQQDPVMQMQQAELQLRQQELELKKQEVEIKGKKQMADAAAQADKIRLDEETLQAKMELEGTKLGMKAKQDEVRMNSENEKEGVRIGADIAKNQAEQVIRARQARNPKGRE
tara:strand:- start:1401 stop:3893 length:2493 start_codon:yes stop_codon:yes gene_type:complete